MTTTLCYSTYKKLDYNNKPAVNVQITITSPTVLAWLVLNFRPFHFASQPWLKISLSRVVESSDSSDGGVTAMMVEGGVTASGGS